MDDSDSDYEYDRHRHHRRHHHRNDRDRRDYEDDYYNHDSHPNEPPRGSYYNHDSHPNEPPRGSKAGKSGMGSSLMEMMHWPPTSGVGKQPRPNQASQYQQGYSSEQYPNDYHGAPSQGPPFYGSHPPPGSRSQQGSYPPTGSRPQQGSFPPTRGSYDIHGPPHDSMYHSESMHEPTVIREIIHEPLVIREVETIVVDQAGRVISKSTSGGEPSPLMQSHSMHSSFGGRPYASVAPSHSFAAGSFSGSPLALEDGSMAPRVIGETVHEPVPVDMPMRSMSMSMPVRSGSMRMVEPSHHWF